MKKVIVYLLPMHFSTGGTEKVIVNLLNEFSVRGYDTIIATTYNQKRPNDLPQSVGFECIFNKNIFTNEAKVGAIDKYFGKFKQVDLTVITFSVNQFTMFIQSKNFLEYSNRIFFHWHFDYKFSFNTLRIFKLKNYIKYIDKVIVLSKEIERDFKSFGIKNTVTIPNPLTYNKVTMPAEKHDKVIFVGRYAEIKQPKHIIEAVAKIKDNLKQLNKKYTFHLYGPDDTYSKADLQKYAKKLKVDSIVKIEGSKTQEELVDIYQKAKLFLMTSYSEGEGLVLYEALTNSTPIISYDISPIKNNIVIDGYNGKLVESNNINELSNVILDCLKDENELKRLSQNAYEFSKKIIKEKNIYNICDLWERLLSFNRKVKPKEIKEDNINPITKQIEFTRPDYLILQQGQENNRYFIEIDNKGLKHAEFYLTDGISRDLEKDVIKLCAKKYKDKTRVYFSNNLMQSNKSLVTYNNREQLDIVISNIGKLFNKKNKYAFTVALIVHENCNNIELSIKSILEQTIGFNNIEIIIIQKDISEKSQRIINYYSERFRNIKVLIQHEYEDLPQMKNKVIDIAQGEFISFIDQEDYYNIYALENLYEEALLRGLNIVGGYNINYNSKNEKSLCWWYKTFNFDRYLSLENKNDDILHDYINISNFIFRTKFLIDNKIKFYNNKYHNKVFVYQANIINKESTIIKKPIVNIFNDKYLIKQTEEILKEQIEAEEKILRMIYDINNYRLVNEVLANRFLYRTINKIIKSNLSKNEIFVLIENLSRICKLIRKESLKNNQKPKLSIEINRIYYDLIENKYDEAIVKMWYYFKNKNAYTTKVYDIYDDKNNIYLKSVLFLPLLDKNDGELVKEIQYKLYNIDTKEEIILKKSIGKNTYYKFDYNYGNYNPYDNFIIEIPKEKLKRGKYKIKYNFLNSLGRVVISNLGIVRKFGSYNINQDLILDFNSSEKHDILVNIKMVEKNKIKKYLNDLKNDIEYLKSLPEYKFEMILLRIKQSINIKKKSKQVLIGELPNTYQDSGAIFFEYLKTQKTDFDYYYVTSNEDLLKKDKRYVKFNSKKHRELFITSDIVMNVQNIDDWSNPFYKRNKKNVPKRRQTDKNVFYAFRNIMRHQKRIFMQHGILYHSGLTDSIFINADFDSLIISTQFEKEVFPKDAREFIECILPRYSNYTKVQGHKINKILFSPTWRTYLKNFKTGGVKESVLIESDYYKNIIEFIQSKKLRNILEENNIELIINIHHTMSEYITEKVKEYELSEKIIINHGDYSVNELIKECDMCITDYSSLFFDFIYQNKPVVHYLFDYEDYYTRIDNNKRKNDSFDIKRYKGSIYAQNSVELIEKIQNIINNNIVYDYDCKFFDVDDPCKSYLEYINNYLYNKESI